MGGKIRGEMTGREPEFECLDVAMATTIVLVL